MKRTALYVLSMAALLLTAACSGGGGGSDEGSPAKVYSQSVTIPAEGTNQLVTLNNLTAPIEAVSALDSWLTVEAATYTSGAPAVRIKATANPNTTERRTKANVVTTSQEKLELTVVQKGQTPTPPEGNTIEDTHNTVTDQPAYAPARPQSQR